MFVVFYDCLELNNNETSSWSYKPWIHTTRYCFHDTSDTQSWEILVVIFFFLHLESIVFLQNYKDGGRSTVSNRRWVRFVVDNTKLTSNRNPSKLYEFYFIFSQNVDQNNRTRKRSIKNDQISISFHSEMAFCYCSNQSNRKFDGIITPKILTIL